jgi:hypothetical protein
MAMRVDGILFDELEADPESPIEGQQWYNTTDKRFRVYKNGATASFSYQAELTAHIGTGSTNPHSTTLEQARQAGATFGGNVGFGTFKITGLGNPSDGTDGVNLQTLKSQLDERLRGLDWQNSIINMTTTTPPVTPITGDRYIVAAGATGDWSGKAKQIAEWDGAAWVFTVPNTGFALTNESDGIQYNYNGSAWVNIGGSVPKGTPVEISDSTNTQGDGSSFAVNNHVHAHGQRGGGNLHSVTSSSGAGFAPQTNRAATVPPTVDDDTTLGYIPGSRWTDVTHRTDWVCISNADGAAVWQETTNVAGVLNQKSGTVLAASFAGTPKKATVTFGTAFGDASYSVQLTPVTSSNVSFNVHVDGAPLAGSFVIALGCNAIASLVRVDWHATKNGEST